jgi:hypothetical protein
MPEGFYRRSGQWLIRTQTELPHLHLNWRKKDGFNTRQASRIFLINSEAETKFLGESCWPADYSIYDIGLIGFRVQVFI